VGEEVTTQARAALADQLQFLPHVLTVRIEVHDGGIACIGAASLTEESISP
jgi:hypothetical protein